jgi:hypothetical protein
MDFEEAWGKVLNYARANKTISTLLVKRTNEVVKVTNQEIVVFSESPKKKRRPIDRHLEKEDFKMAFDILITNDSLTLGDLKPSLIGKRSIIIAFLAMSLNLKYDIRPLRIHMPPLMRE